MYFIRDNYMSASEAVEYGLVDEIIAMDPEKVKNLELPPKSVEPQDFEYGALVGTIIIILLLLYYEAYSMQYAVI